MTQLTRWEPFNEFPNLQDRINRLFREPFRNGWNLAPETPFTVTAFSPAVDIYEDEYKVTLKMEVPGIEEKDINVRLENNTLIVSGERKFENEEKEENFQRIERRYGAFSRSFSLPSTLEPESAAAEYKNGVLHVTFNKHAEAKPKQIKIGIGQKYPAEAKGKAS
jgi:HSP20 family protein